MTTLKKLAIRGAIWTVAGYGALQILRFGTNLILTRLLFPDLFGLMALVNVFILGLHLFSDLGIAPSIIQNKRGDDPDFLNTAWTLQVIRGFVLWLGSLAIAWPIAQLYGQPQLLWLIPTVGLGSIISGFDSTALYTLNRYMAIGQLTCFELTKQFISLAVMIVWSWLSPSIWALVIGGLVSDSIKMVWSHWLIPGSSNRFTWDRDAAKELFSFGGWIFVSTIGTFLADQADRLMLGKLISLEMLGVYGIAFALSDLPRQVIGAISGNVIFPAFSKLTDLPHEAFLAKILHNRKPVLMLMALSLAVLAGFGDLLISVLYDKRYIQATWMLPLLAIGIWPRVLTQTIDPALLAIGQPRYLAYGNFCKFFFMLIGLPLGFYLMNLPGAVIVLALNDLPYYAAVTYGLCREKLNVVLQDIQATALFVALLTVLLLSRISLGLELPIATLFSN